MAGTAVTRRPTASPSPSTSIPEEAPVNHGIFGPEFTFTGEMIAGKITIGPPVLLPIRTSSATPTG